MLILCWTAILFQKPNINSQNSYLFSVQSCKIYLFMRLILIIIYFLSPISNVTMKCAFIELSLYVVRRKWNNFQFIRNKLFIKCVRCKKFLFDLSDNGITGKYWTNERNPSLVITLFVPFSANWISRYYYHQFNF